MCAGAVMAEAWGQEQRHYPEGLKAMWIALVLCQMGSFVLETDIWRHGA